MYPHDPLIIAIHDQDITGADIIRHHYSNKDLEYIYLESLKHCDLISAKYVRPHLFQLLSPGEMKVVKENELWNGGKSGCIEVIEYLDGYYPGEYDKPKRINEWVESAIKFFDYNWLNSLFSLFSPLIDYEEAILVAEESREQYMIDAVRELEMIYPHY